MSEEPWRQIEQPLNVYLFRVTTLVGTQRELLNMKLKTIHQLLQDCNPDLSVHIPGKRSGGDGLETEAGKLEQADLSLTKATIPFPKHLGKEDQQGAGDCEAWEGPINWSPDSWNLAPSWEVEQGLRRRWHKTVTKDPARNGEQPLKG